MPTAALSGRSARGSRRPSYIDSKSLSVGTDGVVRYSVVIVSGSGARNVLFEGLRCATREFRAPLPMAMPTQKFHPAQSDKWQPVTHYGWGGFRAVLLRELPLRPGNLLAISSE